MKYLERGLKIQIFLIILSSITKKIIGRPTSPANNGNNTIKPSEFGFPLGEQIKIIK